MSNFELPENYNFEIEKTLWRIRELSARTVALQMPEGLFLFACTIVDILERVIIMADVIYGACCVDDLTAESLGVDLLVHYGHSCLGGYVWPLVSVSQMSSVRLLYVFVDIAFDIAHLVDTLQANFSPRERIALKTCLPLYNIVLPREKPLSSCEVLGCTAPRLEDLDLIMSVLHSFPYVGDGRFHSEALMIANPRLPLYKLGGLIPCSYSPYTRTLTREYYDYAQMMSVRGKDIELASSAHTFGLVLGTLGRQGSLKVLQCLAQTFEKARRSFVLVLISELSPTRMAHFGDAIDAYVCYVHSQMGTGCLSSSFH
ncbi:LOW QUALITY PROTEIN: 2-(3-amino-3-carboxypropyl)histidine synthase subunit 1-like [Octopus sinensis]|uniref:2-(3-amino-3-carboxypropyl)histidine synthase subunit 1 n=1 Tax=Octopus sinensis TaxID=2607531 RepID=A0A7E6EJV6_9MOLL|nr:LOW QUALITY PROTEIN: 2-(3-amino-3-carboxypropyl)histidine synthase subunit 1-like [Octopus sinensis]